MNYERLLNLKNKYLSIKNDIPALSFESFEKSFEIEYAHNSTAIEGNTLSLIETKVVLEDNISIGGKQLREIYEVVNHKKAFDFIKNLISQNEPLSEKTVKDIHAILMQNIFIGGIYRNVPVRITGARHKPPLPNEMFVQIKNFFNTLPFKTDLNPIELAAYSHAEFVKIHPFEDGNGRTSRLIMNYQLLANGFLPISIQKEDRLNYFDALEEYALNGTLHPFADMIADLEEKRLNEYISIVPQNPEKNNNSN
jgi:Fic family protein